ncbi:TAXI family TRAP transporter solute-binding subunit [Ammoniphilus sp. CFH 90114]|uniref:TAXI family TRAP transporter solute-binding subunit n=1 Tax=Ammoniphilus sp. CFH 90114 TaxID=2493665 RepID=UPI0013E94B89|nr:TAXI family TRAP transporter solute-binding subunit [Ammoniphilus sp. CFH 90114]
MRKMTMILLAASLSGSLLTGCGADTASNAQPAKNESVEQVSADTEKSALEGKTVTILTGGTSGVYFQLGNAMAKIYSEKSGAKASSQTTGASAENAAKIAQKKAEIAFAMADTVSDAYNGAGNFAASGALSNLRGVTGLYANYMQIVTTKDTGISSLEDLKGKRLAVGAMGSGTEIMAKRVLESSGITYDDVNEDFLSFAEGIEGIKNGTMDAAFLSSGYPNSGIMELATTKDIVIIPVPADITAKMKEASPAFTTGKIPAGTYKGIDQEIETTIVKNLLITHSDMSDEEVYQLTKDFYENMDTLKSTHSSANEILLEGATDGMPLPLHPGAEKFFKEKGVMK